MKPRHVPGKEGGVNILLGGGQEERQGWKNLDLFADNADIHHDLNRFPYPFDDNSVDTIEAANILEHLAEWNRAVIECSRILKPGGRLLIQVPHYGSVYMWTHYDHKKAFSAFSFDVFCKSNSGLFVRENENDVMLNEVKVFSRMTRHIMFPAGLWVWGHFFEWVFNLHPRVQLFYELWLSGLFKASGILVVLEK